MSGSSFDFGTFADVYDQWYDTEEGHLFDRLEKRGLRSLIGEIGPGDTMLEVGSGTGWWSRFFVSLGYRVVGVDISAEMVRVARSRDIGHAQFETGDGHRLPFDDHRFSAAAAITSLEFTREPGQVIREMIRCTRPGGRIFLGLLNGEARINQQRKMQGEGAFRAARFLAIPDLDALLGPYGRFTARPCAFPMSLKIPVPVAGWVDDFQARLGLKGAVFIAVRLDRRTP